MRFFAFVAAPSGPLADAGLPFHCEFRAIRRLRPIVRGSERFSLICEAAALLSLSLLFPSLRYSTKGPKKSRIATLECLSFWALLSFAPVRLVIALGIGCHVQSFRFWG